MANLLDQLEQTLAPTKVGIEEFVESSDYCNREIYPRQAVLLKIFFLEELTGPEEDILDFWIRGGHTGTEIVISPNVRERMEFLRSEGYPHFREVDLVGGRRSSKGWMTGVSLAKVMWDALQLQDPGEHYGIERSKDIYFPCVAASEDQAKKYQYADFSNAIQDCKAFEPYLVKSLETEIRIATSTDLRAIAQAKARGNRIQKDIARLRGTALAANAGTLRGLAALGLVIDEMAHMIPGESKSSADEVFKAARPALSQFGRDAMIFCNSSPYTKIGMFYERYEKALIEFDPRKEADDEEGGVSDEQDWIQENGNPRTLMFQFPSWALFEGYQTSKHKFKGVISANPAWDPREDQWSKDDQILISEARSEESDNPETFKVERRGKFAEVTDAFLNPVMVDRMFAGRPKEWEYDAETTNYNLIREPYKTNWGDGVRVAYRYKIHVDPSSTTAGFGFALAHTESFNNWKGDMEEHVVFDIIKRWEPKKFPGGVIRWAPILEEIMEYAEMFRPFEITFDQHQSVDPIQQLTEKLNHANIDCRAYEKYATNEINWKRWEVTKTAMYQGLIHGPFDTEDTKWASQELKFLQQINTGGKFPRVDKQEIGPVQTKDMADCIAEVTYSLIGNLMVNRMRDRLSHSSMMGGSQGGYRIGGGGPPSGPGPASIEDYYGKGLDQKFKREARGYQNPARGITSRGRGRSMGSRTRGF